MAVFARYNEAVWPAQLVLNALALLAVGLAIRKRSASDGAISAILALFWLWMGTAYHLAFFTTINPAAYLFGALSVVQGVLLLGAGIRARQLAFRFRPTHAGIIGAAFVAYALVLYPLLGFLLGHVYPKAPTFGLPCPTTIFTFGLLLWSERRVPLAVVVIPLLWSTVGTVASVTLGVVEDFGLGVAGLVGTAAILAENRRRAATAADTS
jgi:hypothetical protein